MESDVSSSVSPSGGALDHGLGGEIAAGAGPVLDHERLAEPVRQPLADKARQNVRRAAGAKADDDADRMRRITLRPGEARDGGQRDGAGCELQNVPPDEGS